MKMSVYVRPAPVDIYCVINELPSRTRTLMLAAIERQAAVYLSSVDESTRRRESWLSLRGIDIRKIDALHFRSLIKDMILPPGARTLGILGEHLMSKYGVDIGFYPTHSHSPVLRSDKKSTNLARCKICGKKIQAIWRLV